MRQPCPSICQHEPDLVAFTNDAQRLPRKIQSAATLTHHDLIHSLNELGLAVHLRQMNLSEGKADDAPHQGGRRRRKLGQESTSSYPKAVEAMTDLSNTT